MRDLKTLASESLLKRTQHPVSNPPHTHTHNTPLRELPGICRSEAGLAAPWEELPAGWSQKRVEGSFWTVTLAHKWLKPSISQFLVTLAEGSVHHYQSPQWHQCFKGDALERGTHLWVD